MRTIKASFASRDERRRGVSRVMVAGLSSVTNPQL